MRPRVYLDTCVYNRPFDDQSQPRIWLETLASSLIIQMIEDASATLVTSSVIAYETSRNPQKDQRNWVAKTTKLANYSQQVDNDIRQRAIELERNEIKALDALHIACAEAANVDYFVTCDDRLLKRYRALGSPKVEILTPLELVQKYER